MKFDNIINSLLKEEEISREDRLKALKSIANVSPVMLVFTNASRYREDDNTGRVSVNTPWKIVATHPGTEEYDKYFNVEDSPYYGMESTVIKERDTRMHSNQIDIVFAFWPKKEGEYWYNKMELIQGEKYLADDGESTIIEPEGDPIQGWTKSDVKEWEDWVEGWIYDLE